MTEAAEFVLDEERGDRIGLTEAIYCAGKSPPQIAAILDHAARQARSLLLTRLSADAFAALPEPHRAALDYDPVSRSAYAGRLREPISHARIAVVTAGTSDVPVAREVVRTLRFERHAALEITDVGVAGLWRLMRRADQLRRMPVVIVVAGMDAALPSVVGGLVPGVVIAVPTSVGYGVAAGGRTALDAALASCAPGILVVNIDNGYGAACAAIRVLGITQQEATWNAATS